MEERKENLISRKINEETRRTADALYTELEKHFFDDWGTVVGYEHDIVKFLFDQTHPESKIFLNNMLDIFNKHVQSFEEFRFFVNFLQKRITAERKPLYDFLYMFSKFITSGYFKFKNNRIEPIIPTLKLENSLDSWLKTVRASEIKLFDCLISKDGTIYIALWEHELLCYWLSINNIPLDNCLRISQSSAGNKHLTMSSLAPYSYHEKTKDDITMYLTDEQAKSLFRMFMKLSEGKRKHEGISFEQLFCDHSENLGAGKYDERKNLKFNTLTLEEVAGSEIFDAKKCRNIVLEKVKAEENLRRAYLGD